MRYVARKPLTLASRHYGAGGVVALDGVDPQLVKKLVDQRRIIPAPADPTPTPAAPKRKKKPAARRRR